MATPSPWQCAFLSTSESAFKSPGVSLGPRQQQLLRGTASGRGQGLGGSLQRRELR